MKPEIISLPESNISYFETELTTFHSKNGLIISEHWKRFNALLKTNNINLGTNWQKLGITTKSNNKYKYQCAFEANSSTPEFKFSKIQTGKFAKFNHLGPINLISNTFNYIYKTAINEFSLNVDPDRTILHFEKYDSRLNWNNNKSIVEIYLPLYETQ
jgi:predicted transcriptional regulator YdeE